MGGCSLRFPQSLGLIYPSPTLDWITRSQLLQNPENLLGVAALSGVQFHLREPPGKPRNSYHFFEVAGFTYLGDGSIYFFLKKITRNLGKSWSNLTDENFHMGWFNPPRRKFGSSPLLGKRSPLWLQQFTEKTSRLSFFWGGWAAGTSLELDLVCFGGEYMQMRTINLSVVDVVKVLFWYSFLSG